MWCYLICFSEALHHFNISMTSVSGYCYSFQQPYPWWFVSPSQEQNCSIQFVSSIPLRAGFTWSTWIYLNTLDRKLHDIYKVIFKGTEKIKISFLKFFYTFIFLFFKFLNENLNLSVYAMCLVVASTFIGSVMGIETTSVQLQKFPQENWKFY